MSQHSKWRLRKFYAEYDLAPSLEKFYGNIMNTENYNMEDFDNIDLGNFTLQTAPELVILRVSSYKSTFSCTFGFILDAFLVSG